MINLIAIGSSFNNDVLGLQLIESIETAIKSLDVTIHIHYCYSPATELFHFLEKHVATILVDTLLDETPGSVICLDAEQLILEEKQFSSHQLSVANILQLASTLHRLPGSLHILGIGAGNRPLTDDEFVSAGNSLLSEISHISEMNQP